MTEGPFSCKLYRILDERIRLLINRVCWLRQRQPDTYKKHPDVKLLWGVWRVIEESRQDPGHARYRLGKTLGSENTHWRRCKEGLPPRYRLFFRFAASERICVYAWLNNRKTLRKTGSKTDVYAVFQRLLDKGVIPKEFATLLDQSKAWQEVRDAALPLTEQ